MWTSAPNVDQIVILKRPQTNDIGFSKKGPLRMVAPVLFLAEEKWPNFKFGLWSREWPDFEMVCGKTRSKPLPDKSK